MRLRRRRPRELTDELLSEWRATYRPPRQRPKAVKPVEPIYLGDVLSNVQFYGVVADPETPGMMQATLEVAPQCSRPPDPMGFDCPHEEARYAG